jgi:hypothetical protein
MPDTEAVTRARKFLASRAREDPAPEKSEDEQIAEYIGAYDRKRTRRRG